MLEVSLIQNFEEGKRIERKPIGQMQRGRKIQFCGRYNLDKTYLPPFSDLQI